MNKNEPSAALASLTATYTDSDADSSEDIPEENEEKEKEDSEKEVKLEEPKKEENEIFFPHHSPISPPENSSADSVYSIDEENLFPDKPPAPSRLVSYATEGDEKEEEEDEEDDDDDMDLERDDSSGEISASNAGDDSFSENSNLSEDGEDFINNLTLTGEIKLPPEPSGRCSNHLQEKIAKYYEQKINRGMDMNAVIQKRKDFRNPSIYEKLIELCEIDQIGSNCPKSFYDPHSWKPTSFYEELAKVQKAEMDKREKEKKERTKVEFVSGTVKKALDPADDTKKRKTKWDVASTQPSIVSVLKPIVTTSVHNAPVISVSTTASGTRTTIIPAVGNLVKKPRL